MAPTFLDEESNLAQQMLHAYAHTKNRTTRDWDPILAAYRASRQPFIWEMTFAIDHPLYEALLNERAHLHAQQSLKEWVNANPSSRSPALMKMIALLCLTQTGASEEGLRSDTTNLPRPVMDRIAIWERVFANEPMFAPALSHETQAMHVRHANIRTQFASAHAASPDCVVRTFSLPAQCTARVVGEEAWLEFTGVPPQALARVNAFAAEYLGSTRFSRSEDGTQWLVHAASASPATAQADCLRKELVSTWGEYLQGMSALVGNQEVRPGWDVGKLEFQGEALGARPGKTPRP